MKGQSGTAYLDDGQPNNGKQLSTEHGSWRNLHVVADLHVGLVLEAVIGKHVAKTLEEHHGHRPSWEHVTDDHLRDDVQTGLRVCHSLDDAWF